MNWKKGFKSIVLLVSILAFCVALIGTFTDEMDFGNITGFETLRSILFSVIAGAIGFLIVWLIYFASVRALFPLCVHLCVWVKNGFAEQAD